MPSAAEACIRPDPVIEVGLWLVARFSEAVHSFSDFLLGGDYFAPITLIPVVIGVSLIFWGAVGVVRTILQKLIPSYAAPAYTGPITDIFPHEVAVIIPAHNEELVIAETIRSLTPIANPRHIYIVSDGSSDRTVEIAKSFGANVIDLQPSHGKAGALEACIRHFSLAHRYKAVLLVDADTRLAPDYLVNALPLFRDPAVVAVAGYARTIWEPEVLTPSQKLFVLHRDRVYFLSQTLIKFGQTWKHTNVTHIVPGFASMYRTSVLDKVTINPKGLVIEDFNMTFEIHHKQLGIIAHRPDVIAYTQDPDNWKDYFKQIRRWHLGLWQTIRMHGVWASRFWAALTLTLFEVVLGSLVFLIVPGLAIAGIIYEVALALFRDPEWLAYLHTALPHPEAIFWSLVLVWATDYLMSVATAIAQKRPEYLVYGLFFPIVRVLDAVAFLEAIPRAFIANSNGKWVSPTRRTNAAS